MKKVIRGKQNFNANCLISLKNLAKKLIEPYRENILPQIMFVKHENIPEFTDCLLYSM